MGVLVGTAWDFPRRGIRFARDFYSREALEFPPCPEGFWDWIERDEQPQVDG